MRRAHLFEIADQPWCPTVLRRGLTEFLSAVSRVLQIYRPTAEVLQRLLARSQDQQIVVLGAGSGGGIVDVLPFLPAQSRVILTDILPDRNFSSLDPRISYYPDPVDAMNVPSELKGIRVMYAAFHHFDRNAARSILASAVREGCPVAIFEGTERSPKGLFLAMTIPPFVWAMTPFIRPFRWSRLWLTYLIPVFPLMIFWDGLVSALRTYSESDLRELVADFENYGWTFQTLKGPHGEHIPCLEGEPKMIPALQGIQKKVLDRPFSDSSPPAFL